MAEAESPKLAHLESNNAPEAISVPAPAVSNSVEKRTETRNESRSHREKISNAADQKNAENALNDAAQSPEAAAEKVVKAVEEEPSKLDQVMDQLGKGLNKMAELFGNVMKEIEKMFDRMSGETVAMIERFGMLPAFLQSLADKKLVQSALLKKFGGRFGKKDDDQESAKALREQYAEVDFTKYPTFEKFVSAKVADLSNANLNPPDGKRFTLAELVTLSHNPYKPPAAPAPQPAAAAPAAPAPAPAAPAALTSTPPTPATPAAPPATAPKS